MKRALTLNSFTVEQIAFIQEVPIEEVERIKNDLANPPEEEQSEDESHSSDNQDIDNTDL